MSARRSLQNTPPVCSLESQEGGTGNSLSTVLGSGPLLLTLAGGFGGGGGGLGLIELCILIEKRGEKKNKKKLCCPKMYYPSLE